MNRKRLLGLILFACLVTGGLLISADYLTNQGAHTNTGQEQSYTKDENDEKDISVDTLEVTTDSTEDSGDTSFNIQNAESDSEANAESDSETANTKDEEEEQVTEQTIDIAQVEPWLNTNPTDVGAEATQEELPEVTVEPTSSAVKDTAGGTFTTSLDAYEAPQLIYDCNTVDYEKYIPEMMIDSALEAALDIDNPELNVDAEAAILFDASSKKILFYKNAVQAKFPASTAKLLTSLVALEWCSEEEQVTVGDEVTMIASDSTRAYLRKGQILTIRNLLEAMLLPSGNDAAYVVAAYVGRKSLDKKSVAKEEAIAEFVRLMNEKAYHLGVKNSYFKTPDGYDAIGQYTTAYDMGLIGIAAADNAIITEVSSQSSSRNIFVSGEDVTWSNTNKLVTKYSGQYLSNAIGLKTGTSTMAGRCLVAAAEKDGRRVVCVVLDSSLAGRWEDAITMLKYGLE